MFCRLVVWYCGYPDTHLVIQISPIDPWWQVVWVASIVPIPDQSCGRRLWYDQQRTDHGAGLPHPGIEICWRPSSHSVRSSVCASKTVTFWSLTALATSLSCLKCSLDMPSQWPADMILLATQLWWSWGQTWKVEKQNVFKNIRKPETGLIALDSGSWAGGDD